MSYSLQASASSSASTGPSKSGDISGGTAWNIQGINLGEQYQAPATAGGGVADPGQFAGVSGLPSWAVPLAIGIVITLALSTIIAKRAAR